MRIAFVMLTFLVVSTADGWTQNAGTWLDRPMQGWNAADGAIPSPRERVAVSSSALERCRVTLPAAENQNASSPTSSLSRAGWRPFLHQDSVLARQGIEIVAGLTDVTQGCEPAGFNLFVFVDGHYAGTLAPLPMTIARDGAIGAVRIVSATSLTAEFARYAANDPECCPSSRVRVTYRVDRGTAPVVTPVSSQSLR
jgi:hypothetical protein